MSRYSPREITITALFTGAACVTGLLFKAVPPALVPFSLLPLLAMLAGALLGSRLGPLSMTLYLLLGLLGVPVFSVPPYGGLSYLLQPTFGFIPGFILCAYLMGKLLEKQKDPPFSRYLLALLAGLGGLYAAGLTYLYLILSVYLGRDTGFREILTLGFLPYIAFDLAKGVVSFGLAREITRRLGIIIRPGAGDSPG